MKFLFATLLLLQFQLCTCQTVVYETSELRIQKITDRVFVHITYLQTDSFGKVACNGMIYMNKKYAIVFDTPSNDNVSIELMAWLERQGLKIKAVVVNHFHIDALGGLAAFHKAGIPSYGHAKTIELAQLEKPQNGFTEQKKMKIGGLAVVNRYFGEAHTVDNISSYLPKEGVLFGGCMIKSLNAGKGNLADANTNEWSTTVKSIMTTYPAIKIVIPGHGDFGDARLLENTIKMFELHD